MPGQSTREGYQQLETFADEVPAPLDAPPMPAEVLVERVRPLRFAERDVPADTMLAVLNGHAG